MTEEEKAFVAWLDEVRFWDVIGPRDIQVMIAKYRAGRAAGQSDQAMRDKYTAVLAAAQKPQGDAQ